MPKRYPHHDFADALADVAAEAAAELEQHGDYRAAARLRADAEQWRRDPAALAAERGELYDAACEASYLRGKVNDPATLPAVARAYTVRLAELSDDSADDDSTPGGTVGCLALVALPAAGVLTGLLAAAVSMFG